ncbi:putative component of NuA3 histone acetyltransferase complex [Coemansia sp. RSA 1813]|nr:putative component of NuA3 histone acetyltransferase complex [Coemansia sp. RSA 1646]KAJ1767264.1 putative component of NuA3 histone acetyltransferase complex [Coemansia sp. RSA 1843]KAJ2086033.1 putative component of NuA3 histone acetyltransferase complex [Coemansia sp. RSA 986]KAJ2563750.1 putative component of NuA3 histone acetyltransferase complex [Coemansia sp. RSA 1813]
MNQSYLDPEFIDSFHKAFTCEAAKPEDASQPQTVSVPVESGKGIVVASPFHTGKLCNILPKEFLQGLRKELSELNWHERLNDLYWFYQTDDLALNGKAHIKALRDYLAGEEFVGFMEKITGVELTRGYLDLAAQRYKRGNHLLCHDDDVQRGRLTRKIAYIIYLVDEGWCPEDGGALGLFESDADMCPTRVVARIVPEFNSIGFFLTGHASYHTVEEVTVGNADRERWSVTGWFYGPAPPEPAAPRNSDTATLSLQDSVLPQVVDFAVSDDIASKLRKGDHAELEKWINADYTSAKVIDRIQDAFLSESSVELRDFLRAELFDKCVAELDDGFWSNAALLGPAHVAKYIRANVTSLSAPTLYELLAFLRSPTFARFLSGVTSLEFTGVSQEVRRFKHGDYTLIHDQIVEPFGVDVTLSLVPRPEAGLDGQWEELWGGATHYIADRDELLRISPETNSLSLVLRDEGTLRFVKYVNYMAKAVRQDISMVFVEPPHEEEEEEDGDSDAAASE